MWKSLWNERMFTTSLNWWFGFRNYPLYPKMFHEISKDFPMIFLGYQATRWNFHGPVQRFNGPTGPVQRLSHLHGVGQALGWATGHLHKLSVDMEIQKRKERKEKEVSVYIHTYIYYNTYTDTYTYTHTYVNICTYIYIYIYILLYIYIYIIIYILLYIYIIIYIYILESK